MQPRQLHADASQWHATRLSRELDYFDETPDVDTDEGTYGYCPECECNTRAVTKDFGIGCYEYWGSRGVHHDWRDVCPTCEGDLTAPLERDEDFEPEA